jgi:hypothetical protein
MRVNLSGQSGVDIVNFYFAISGAGVDIARASGYSWGEVAAYQGAMYTVAFERHYTFVVRVADGRIEVRVTVGFVTF